jgi:threonine synthase
LSDLFRCTCGEDSLLDVRQDFGERYDRIIGRDTVHSSLGIRPACYDGRQSGVWRFKSLVMPDLPDDQIVSRGEGNTRLYEFTNVNRWLQNPNVLFKHEGENPTGSFKDRGMTVAVSWAKYQGARTIACASTGNTAASVASYAALAGLRSVIIVPEKATAIGKISQSLAYGARTIMIRGNFDEGLRLLLEAKDALGLAVMNSVNPYRLEGQKTVMFELFDQLENGWGDQPDWIVVPGGNLGNAAAFGKAIVEAYEVGLLQRKPRLAIVQAEGASPLYKAFRDGWSTYAPMTPDTIATAIRIGAPVNVPKAIRALKDTNGVVTCVDDQQIMDAKAVLDSDGVGAEPAACASAAGIRRLRTEGVIGENDRVVAVLTGHMLKDPDATIGYHSGTLASRGLRSPLGNAPIVIDPSKADLANALKA